MHSISLNFQVGDLPSLHPHLTALHLRSCCLSKLLFECLTRINLKGEAELAGAESMEISSDSMTYTFTLRNHSWSDGSAVTAFQYEDTWKAAIERSPLLKGDLFYKIKNASRIKKGILSIDALGVRALDDKTLVVQLEFPCPDFLKLLAHHIFAPLQDPKQEPKEFNGSFVVDQWNKGEKISLKKNPHFWNTKNIFFNDIKISFITDPAITQYLYDNGELDWVGSPFGSLPSATISSLEKQKKLYRQDSSSVLWVYFNTRFSPFHSAQIRQALNLAIDRDELNKYLLHGKTLTTPLPPALSLISQHVTKDQQEARRQFALGLQEIGLTIETFPEIELSCTNSLKFRALNEYLQRTWQEVFGITVYLESTNWNTFIKNLQAGDFQIGGFYEKAACSDPMDFLEKFDYSNLSGWIDPHFQDKLSLARQTREPSQRKQWLQQAEEILVKQAPVIPIATEVQFYTHKESLEGYVFDFSGAIDLSYAHCKD